MRRGNDPTLVLNDAVIVGVSFGSDFVSEHEWGIAGIKRAFGILGADERHKFVHVKTQPVFGLERRKTQQVPRGLYWHEGKGVAGFALWPSYDGKQRDPQETREISFYGATTLAAAWDKNTFAVLSRDEEEQRQLRKLYNALMSLDAVIFLGRAETPFDNPGLCVAIASQLPAELIEAWYAADKEAYEVEQEFAACGIEEALRAANKKYLALSPRRENGGLKFWLNPYFQDKDNCGWFTLQDLQAWIHNEGPIPMKHRGRWM